MEETKLTMQAPAFSIVVPAYNEERYLSSCVESLQNQTLKDIEIVIVDDGSTDKTGQIADWYARQDSRIRVVHKQNAGLGPARNTGMSCAHGKYIGFADSDDWAEPEMFEKLYARAEQTQADMVFTGVKTVRRGLVTEVHEQFDVDHVLSDDQSLFEYRRHYYGFGRTRSEMKQIPGYVWDGGFKRSFIEQHQLQFQNVLSEDEVFLISAFQVAKTVAFIPGTLYCYRRDDQASITNSFKPKDVQSFFANMRAIRRLIDNEPGVYKQESMTRWYRHVIDLSRALVHRIESSSLSSSEKSRYTSKANQNPMLKEACSHYSWQDLPLQFVPFFWCQQQNVVWAERLMMQMWICISAVAKSRPVLYLKNLSRPHPKSGKRA